MSSPKKLQRLLTVFLAFLIASAGLALLTPSSLVDQPLRVDTNNLSPSGEEFALGVEPPTDGSVSILYETIRGKTVSKNGESKFGSEIAPPSYGIAHVKIREESKKESTKQGGFSLKNLLGSTKDPATVRDIVPLSKDRFSERLRQDARRSGEVLVFVHGYNVGFESAARCTAELVHRLGFKGTAVMYSWPSQARPTVSDYWKDTASVLTAAPHFKDLLCHLTSKLRPAKIHVVAHSLGSLLVGGAVASISADQGSSTERILDQIVFAAPDIDIAAFQEVIAPLSIRIANRVTVYASQGDLALNISKQMHGKRQRLGQMVSKMMSIDGVDTVDVSTVNSASFGHSYFSESQAVIDDLSSVLQGCAPAERQLSKNSLDAEGKAAWTLQKLSDDSLNKLAIQN